MADLANKLVMRRKGISGAGSTNPGGQSGKQVKGLAIPKADLSFDRTRQNNSGSSSEVNDSDDSDW